MPDYVNRFFGAGAGKPPNESFPILNNFYSPYSMGWSPGTPRNGQILNNFPSPYGMGYDSSVPVIDNTRNNFQSPYNMGQPAQSTPTPVQGGYNPLPTYGQQGQSQPALQSGQPSYANPGNPYDLGNFDASGRLKSGDGMNRTVSAMLAPGTAPITPDTYEGHQPSQMPGYNPLDYASLADASQPIGGSGTTPNKYTPNYQFPLNSYLNPSGGTGNFQYPNQ